MSSSPGRNRRSRSSSPGTLKKKKVASRLPGTPGKQRKERLVFPENEKRLEVLVYDKPKTKKQKIQSNPLRIQGVWEDSELVNVASPCEVWCYKSEPGNLAGSKHIHGKWGYKPGTVEDLQKAKPEDIWFFSPKAQLPAYFTPQGTWMFPVLERDVSRFAPEESGFIDLSRSVKSHKLDVAGQWRLLYKHDGEDEEEEEEKPIGPGIRPRTPPPVPVESKPSTPKRKSPKPKPPPPIPDMNIFVRTPDGKTIGPFSVKPQDTIGDIKDMVNDREGIPPSDQRLKFGNEELNDDHPTLKDTGIKDEDVLDLQPMEIYVKHWNGSTFAISPVTPNNSIDDVQSVIEEIRNIPISQQRLIFNDKALKDPSRTLRQYKIKHQSTLELLPMNIHVVTPDGTKKITLQVEPEDTIVDVKKKIYNKEGLPVEDQRLTSPSGKPLEKDKSTLAAYNIQHDDVLQLEPMAITIRQPNGKMFTLENVDPQDTIEDIQDRILSKKGIPKKDQRLAFQDKPLKDPSKALKDYKIKHESVLDLLPMIIQVKTPEGKVVPLQVTPDEKPKDLKPRVEKKTGIPPEDQRYEFNGKPLKDNLPIGQQGIEHGDTIDMDPMKIFVKDPTTNMTYTLGVNPADTISEIKDKAKKQSGIPPKNQRLTFEGTPLKNDRKSIKDYGIKHKSTLMLEPMIISVKTPQGKKIPFQVTLDDMPGTDLKPRIEAKTGIPVDEQRLELPDGTPLNDKKPLGDQGINHGDTLEMQPMEIYVEDIANGGKTHTLSNVKPSDTIQDIKKRVEKKTGIPLKLQRLAFGGKQLNKDSKTLKQCGIKDKDTLQLEPLQVHVKTPDGKKLTLTVAPDDTPEDVKKQVEDRTGIPPKDEELKFDDNPLKPNKPIFEQGVNHGDTLDMEMEIYVAEPNGKVHTLSNVHPAMTIDEVKDMVKRKTKIPKDQQRLTFGGKPLSNDNKTLKDCNIKHKSTLNLEPMQVHVQTPEGKKITLTVTPDDKPKDLKALILEKTNIPIDEQRLEFNSKPLVDTTPIGKQGVEHNDTIFMDPMLIFVKDNNTGKKYTLGVVPTETLAEIKDKIEDKAGVPKKRQRLTFGGKPMNDNNKILRDLGIKHKSTLELQPMTIAVNTPEKKKIKLTVNEDDTPNDIKKQVEDKTGIPVEDQRLEFKGQPLNDREPIGVQGIKDGDIVDMLPMTIYVKDPNGKIYTVPNVLPSNTIDDVKRKVEQDTGIPKKQQRLTFRGTPLSDDKKALENYNIKHEDVLDLEPMEIAVKTPDGKKIKLAVKPDDKPKDIKKQVEDITGIPVPDQRLEVKGRPLKDNEPIGKQGIQHGDIVDMMPMTIYVKDLTRGQTYTLPNMLPSDTIDDVKRKIERDSGTPKDQQRLTFGSKPLTDDGKTLDDCNIKHESVLTLEPMQITVKTPDGKKIQLTVTPDDKPKDLKPRIGDKTGIPVPEQRLEFNGEPLDDNEPIGKQGVRHGDVVELQPMVINVRKPDGMVFKLTVTPEDTINEVKRKIKDKEGIAPHVQRLFFGSTLLDEPTDTLRDSGVKHGSTLDLKDPKPLMKLVASPRASPKKKSYLPEDWKEKRKGYGEVVESFYKTNYSADTDHFLEGKTGENRTKLELDFTRPSEREKEG